MDLTTFWVFVQKNRRHAGAVFVGILLFIVGVQVGRITSPYYAAHPIIFEDRSCDACSSSGGTTEELSALKEAGIAEREPATKQAGGGEQSVVPKPAVAGITEPESQTTGQFVASKNSTLYHHPSCPSVSRIKEENKLWFANQAAAETAGYRPSECTKEKLGM